jgi:hypothetical protein
VGTLLYQCWFIKTRQSKDSQLILQNKIIRVTNNFVQDSLVYAWLLYHYPEGDWWENSLQLLAQVLRAKRPAEKSLVSFAGCSCVRLFRHAAAADAPMQLSALVRN